MKWKPDLAMFFTSVGVCHQLLDLIFICVYLSEKATAPTLGGECLLSSNISVAIAAIGGRSVLGCNEADLAGEGSFRNADKPHTKISM